MIKNFDNFIAESFRRHRAYGAGGYKFKVYDDGSVEVQNRHPNMGMINWFTIDEKGYFHTDTSATEEFVLNAILEIIDDKYFISFLKEYPIFAKLIERAKKNVTYKKFGL